MKHCGRVENHHSPPRVSPEYRRARIAGGRSRTENGLRMREKLRG
jgi:hypothetical protein